MNLIYEPFLSLFLFTHASVLSGLTQQEIALYRYVQIKKR